MISYFKNLPTAYVDMWIYVGVAFFSAWTVAFGTDDASKFIAGWVLFWLKSGCAAISGSLLAAKMFRSTGFSQHLEEKKHETQPPFK